MKDEALMTMRKYTLKKLPMWGKKVQNDEINFQWPSQAMLNEMEPDAWLESIQFKGMPEVVLSSVQVTLSNGQKSPVFESTSIKHKYVETLKFTKAKPVRKVGALCGMEERSNDWVANISFYQANDDLISRYSPNKSTITQQVKYEIE